MVIADPTGSLRETKLLQRENNSATLETLGRSRIYSKPSTIPCFNLPKNKEVD
jgi:hypothetical protein